MTNEITELKAGDYIEKSELDTEQKYNDVVEVFESFGFPRNGEYALTYRELTDHSREYALLAVKCGMLVGINEGCEKTKRKLTYNDIMSLKKVDVDNCNIDKVVGNETAEIGHDKVRNPSHYQLIEGIESIEVIARSMTKEQWKGFCLGNMLKYRIRAGKKDALQKDIDKANFYGELYEMHLDKCYS